MAPRKTLALPALVFLVITAAATTTAAQDAVKPESLAGAWDIEIAAEGQYVYVTFVLEVEEGRLAGKVTERYGMFTDVPCDNLTLEGRRLGFSANLLSPPDGTVKIWKVDVEVDGDAMTGSISNSDVAITASFVGKKAK
jgi:hypothetical protein